jgi:hypothetical protein
MLRLLLIILLVLGCYLEAHYTEPWWLHIK